MMNVLFLGTACMFPTKERSHSAVLVEKSGDCLLFDCGEGVQRQLRIAGVSPMKIHRIFLSHWHGDHSLGIGGLIQSLSASGKKSVLHIYGPEGTQKSVNNLLKAFLFRESFVIEAHDITADKPKIILNAKDFSIYALSVPHGVPCLAYKIVESSIRKIDTSLLGKFGLKAPSKLLGELQKGRSVNFKDKTIKPSDVTFIKPGKVLSYVTDTKYSKDVVDFVKDSDVLICEATYCKEHENKALEFGHMTADIAGRIAKEAGVKKLFITHFSQRYKDEKPLLEEARKVHKDTVAAKDFLKFSIK